MSRKNDVRTVVVQLLLLPAVSHDSETGASYKGVLTFSATYGQPFGGSRTFFVAPVPPRLTANQVAAALLDEMERTGKIPPRCPIITVPVIEISPAYADEIIEAYRDETEKMLREKELEMLRAMWELPSDGE